MDEIAQRNVLVKEFANSINYKVKDVQTLRIALTHRSFTSENEGAPNNERLEFLGDAVLDMAVSDLLLCPKVKWLKREVPWLTKIRLLR